MSLLQIMRHLLLRNQQNADATLSTWCFKDQKFPNSLYIGSKWGFLGLRNKTCLKNVCLLLFIFFYFIPFHVISVFHLFIFSDSFSRSSPALHDAELAIIFSCGCLECYMIKNQCFLYRAAYIELSTSHFPLEGSDAFAVILCH